MKRKWAWLALPLVLCAVVWSVKWYGEHPAPTKLDLEIRALLSRSPKAEVTFSRINTRNSTVGLSVEMIDIGNIPSVDLKATISEFRIGSMTKNPFVMSDKVSLGFYVWHSKEKDKQAKSDFFIIIDPKKKSSYLMSYRPIQGAGIYQLHPATTKRWLEFLLNHPTIGPEIRERLGQQ